MDSEDRHQLELLPPTVDPHIEPITSEMIRSIRKRPTFLSAWTFAQDFAALQDKQVYDILGIDSSHYTKIRKGNASPPGDERFDRYLDVVANEIPLVWWVEKRGYDWMSLRKHQSSEQLRIAELEDENRSLKRTLGHVLDSQRGKP